MDPKLFEQLLSELGEFKRPKLSDTDIKQAMKSQRSVGRPSAEDQFQVEHFREYLERHGGINPTHAPELVKLKTCERKCDDCDRVLQGAPRRDIKYFTRQPNHINHMRIRCLDCGFYRHPETGVYDLAQGPACQTFLNWAKREYTLRKRQTKTDPDK